MFTGVEVKNVTFSVFKNDKEYFSYKKGFYRMISGAMLGTFAKLDDGWKFYPKFYDTLVSHDKLLKLYLGKQYDYGR